ncbi:MAG: hypothetical protein ACOCQ0_01085, partial [Desulfosalsimonas sp.]
VQMPGPNAAHEKAAPGLARIQATRPRGGFLFNRFIIFVLFFDNQRNPLNNTQIELSLGNINKHNKSVSAGCLP